LMEELVVGALGKVNTGSEGLCNLGEDGMEEVGFGFDELVLEDGGVVGVVGE
jgi:hypothetical protein